jgi:hypothetical protein
MHSIADASVIPRSHRIACIFRSCYAHTHPLQAGRMTGMIEVRMGYQQVGDIVRFKPPPRAIRLNQTERIRAKIPRIDHHQLGAQFDDVAILVLSIWEPVN